MSTSNARPPSACTITWAEATDSFLGLDDFSNLLIVIVLRRESGLGPENERGAGTEMR